VPADNSGHPTGLVFNGTSGFEIESGGVSGPAFFIFVSLEGRIFGWNPNVSASSAIVVADNPEEVYTGAALAESQGETFLYVANFAGGEVDVYDSNFEEVDSFTDPTVPKDYSPFGIAAIGDEIYVTFAKVDPMTGEELKGPGFGFVSVFDTDGTYVRTLISHGELNAPWGLVEAPGGFGKFSHKLLVGNFGDGRILAYNPHNGRFLGALEDEDGEAIVIEGIWGLLFGNGGQGGDPHDLYFTAGIADETHGVFGEIELEHH
jgi:uncharacterized protein (TIGR03118 family)